MAAEIESIAYAGATPWHGLGTPLDEADLFDWPSVCAIQRASGSQIDLVITDIVMPNREGIETIRYLSKALPNVPIVAISGNSSYLRPAKALGAAATLEKAAVAADLLGTVQSVIGC